MKKLVIIPAYNEEKSIGKLLDELERVAPDYDYIVVNDCSLDHTSQIVRKKQATAVIDLPVNLGIGGAVQTGYLYALRAGYDIAVQMDGDGQHDPAYLDALTQPIERGDAEICIGSRFLSGEGFQSSRVRRIGIAWLSMLIRWRTGVRIQDVTSGFRAVDRSRIQLFARNYPQDYPEPEAIVIALRSGARVKEVPTIMRARETGVSSITFLRSVYYMVKVTLSLILADIAGKEGRYHI